MLFYISIKLGLAEDIWSVPIFLNDISTLKMALEVKRENVLICLYFTKYRLDLKHFYDYFCSHRKQPYYFYILAGEFWY